MTLELCMRAENWGKSVQHMKFLNNVTNNVPTLSVGKGVNNVEWSIDSTFAVHPHFKSHVGATMGFKDGLIYQKNKS